MADPTDFQRSPARDDETHVISSTGASDGDALVDNDNDNGVTVLTTLPALAAQEYPQGLSPRELALTLKGELLGHFHLIEFVGGGGMGAVFKALDTTLDRIVAVKVVASQSISSEDLRRRFLVEAQSTARLDHPNIARIHFVGHDRGLPYIVFEYIDGVNLRDLVFNQGPIPLGDALSFTCQIAHALAHAWQKEVVHRDIKPSNILITREGQAKLVDMGLARFHQVGATDNDLTSTGVTLGTFDYISPEQARDPREADTRSDIYSLGCTFFFMLAGRPPFPEGTAVQKLLQHQDEIPPNLSQLRPDIPESVSQLVLHMLEKNPELRPQTPNELVVRCYHIFQELGLQPPPSLAPLPLIPQEVTPSVWRRHFPWAIPLAVLFAAAFWIGGGRWMANRLDPVDAVAFPPLRHPISQPAAEPFLRREDFGVFQPVPSVLESAAEKSRLSEATEVPRRVGVGTLLDSAASLPYPIDPPSLLEFSADEPAPVEGNSSGAVQEFDFEGL